MPFTQYWTLQCPRQQNLAHRRDGSITGIGNRGQKWHRQHEWTITECAPSVSREVGVFRPVHDQLKARNARIKLRLVIEPHAPVRNMGQGVRWYALTHKLGAALGLYHSDLRTSPSTEITTTRDMISLLRTHWKLPSTLPPGVATVEPELYSNASPGCSTGVCPTTPGEPRATSACIEPSALRIVHCRPST